MVEMLNENVKAPVYANAPLLRPLSGKMTNECKSTGQWPLVIFSHGLGGSRTAYSHLCSRLAASGKVILAIEHRDGTGHACITRSWGDDGQKVSRPIYYLKEDQVMWEDQPADGAPMPFALRAKQLEFRRKEIYTAYNTFHKFLRGEKTELETIDGRIIHNSWRIIDNDAQTSPVRCEDVTLMGHSFGGCTVLSILSTPSSSEYEYLPTSQALVLDPWLEPLPIPGPMPHSRTGFGGGADSDDFDSDIIVKDGSVLPQILVINSETFTLWDEHFSRLQKVVKAWEAERIITLVGSKHQSFSDFGILPLINTKEAIKLHERTVSISLAFLDYNLEQHLQEAPIRDMEAVVIGMKDNGKPKRKLLGNVGDIIVH
ncbi:hypothetical protein APHAL10511_001755 [Amanita phalloides]|nr:hypothetical protein APHAL10511_001755 [Amanita phalloides]